MSKENIPRAIVAPEMFRWARERANLPQKAIDDAIHAEEQMRGGREAFIRRHGNRDYEALEMVRIHLERKQS